MDAALLVRTLLPLRLGLRNGLDGVGLVGAALAIDLEDASRGVGVLRANAARAGGGRVGVGGSGVGTTVDQGTADGEDDAHGHGGGDDGGHARDDGLNGVFDAGGRHDEPEEHVGHVDRPDSL